MAGIHEDDYNQTTFVQTADIYILGRKGKDGREWKLTPDGMFWMYRDEGQDWVVTDIPARGPQGEPLRFEDLTPEQIEQITGPQGEPLRFEDLTPEQVEEITGPQGEPFTWEDLTPDQKEELKGDPLTWEDLTPEQIEEITGPEGPPMRYEDLTPEQKEELAQHVTEQGGRIQSVAPGTLPAGPVGETRYMKVTAVGTWTYGGSPVGSNAEGFETTFWWTGSTWVQNEDSVKIVGPTPEGTDILESEEIPKGKAVVSYVDPIISELKGDFVDFNFGGTIDWENRPQLTDGRYISRTGGFATTTPTSYAATEEFLPLYGAKKLHYFGEFGESTTSLVFYAEKTIASKVLAVPSSDMKITEGSYDVPANAKYYRATCKISEKNNFKIILEGLSNKIINLQSFRMVGVPVYQNNAVKESDVVWNDGSTGRAVFGDWDEVNLTFKSFEATSIENGLKVTQPPVVFNSSNQITSYPNFIITSI